MAMALDYLGLRTVYKRFFDCRYFVSHTKYPADKTLKGAEREKFIVPKQPTKSKIDPSKLPLRTTIDAETITHLERLSLVDCANREGIETLEEAIAFADQILQIDTTGIEPMITVWEDIPLSLREDENTEGDCKEDILKNAFVTEEEYFVAPPGNIPLEDREDPLFEKEARKHDLKKT